MKKYLRFAAFTAGTTLAGTWIASAQEAPAPADDSSAPPHTVVAEDHLAQLSLAEPGDSRRWTEIFALNHQAVARPRLIAAGLAFRIQSATPILVDEGPPPAAQPPADPAPAITHTVAAGEGLSGIAQSTLGASNRWVEIYALNQSVLAAPDLLHVGLVLDIPTAPVTVPDELLASLTALRSSSAQGTTSTPAAAATFGGGGGGGTLAAIRACESSGNYGAVSASGQYRGAYQFDVPTWQSVGGTGDPAAAAPAEQDARATQLLNQRGSNPWPNCG